MVEKGFSYSAQNGRVHVSHKKGMSKRLGRDEIGQVRNRVLRILEILSGPYDLYSKGLAKNNVC